MEGAVCLEAAWLEGWVAAWLEVLMPTFALAVAARVVADAWGVAQWETTWVVAWGVRKREVIKWDHLIMAGMMRNVSDLHPTTGQAATHLVNPGIRSGAPAFLCASIIGFTLLVCGMLSSMSDVFVTLPLSMVSLH